MLTLADDRQAVLAKCGGLCIYCAWPAEEVDHVIPLCLGGSGEWWNLWPACRRCNRSKCGRTPDLWLEAQRRQWLHDWAALPWPTPMPGRDAASTAAAQLQALWPLPLPGYLADLFQATEQATATRHADCASCAYARARARACGYGPVLRRPSPIAPYLEAAPCPDQRATPAWS